ncbi:MAG: leucyl/phenylalanyl-tRNA--protein transferase [Phenylobacterium sp.]|jgi:leucyl/phenylalanyl-tRNA--protein transferase
MDPELGISNMAKVIYQLYPDDISFPAPADALDDPNGLLAVGGHLSPQRLLNGYRHGIFPWYSADEPLMWWSPDPRGVLFFEDFYINRSFAKFLRKMPFRLSVNKAFDDVITLCSSVPRNDDGTWITTEMIQAYINLHQLGFAHSIEVWQGKTLVGGLYGVMVGGCFCGESMFHLQPNASKVAYWGLVNWLQQHQAHFIDCQMQNDFLQTLGVSEISRELYLEKLNDAQGFVIPHNMFKPQDIDFSHIT